MAKKPAKKAVNTAKPKAKAAQKQKVAPKAAKKVAPKAKPVAKKTTKVAPKLVKKAAPAKKAVKKTVAKPVAKKAAPKAKVVAAPKANKKVVKPLVKQAAPAKKTQKAVATKKTVTPVAKKTVSAPIKKEVAKPVEKVKKVTKSVVSKQNKRSAAPLPKLAPRRILKKSTPEPAIFINTDKRSRYSDAELNEFKELITGKLETSRGELKYLQEQISRSSEMGDDSDARFKGLEDGTSTSEREYLSQMASRQIQYIGHLEKALIRIENKTYGICRETGKLISKERLRAVPHATLSIEAKQGKG